MPTGVAEQPVPQQAAQSRAHPREEREVARMRDWAKREPLTPAEKAAAREAAKGKFRVTHGKDDRAKELVIEAANDREAWTAFCEHHKINPPPKTGRVEKLVGKDWQQVYPQLGA